MKHFFKKLLLSLFIIFITTTTIIVSSGFIGEYSNENQQEQEQTSSDQTTAQEQGVALEETSVEFIEPTINIINSDLGKTNGEVYFEWELIDPDQEVETISINMMLGQMSKNAFLEKEEFPVNPTTPRVSFSISNESTEWNNYEKGSLKPGIYTQVRIDAFNSQDNVIKTYSFNDIEIKDGVASDPILKIEHDSIEATDIMYEENDTTGIKFDYFYSSVANDYVEDTYKLTELIFGYRDIETGHSEEIIQDPLLINDNQINKSLFIPGAKPNGKYQVYIKYTWEAKSSISKEAIVLSKQIITPQYSDVRVPSITDLESSGKPEDITPTANMKNGEIALSWTTKDQDNAINKIVLNSNPTDGNNENTTIEITEGLEGLQNYTFKQIGAGEYAPSIGYSYWKKVGGEIIEVAPQTFANVIIEEKQVPGVMKSTTEDVYNGKDETLTTYVLIDNTDGDLQEGGITTFSLLNSDNEIVDEIKLPNNNYAKELGHKIFEIELFFEGVEPGEYHLDITMDLEGGGKHTYTIVFKEFLPPVPYGIISVSVIAGLLIIAGLSFLWYRRHKQHKIWKNDLVEKSFSENEKELKIKIQLLSLTKVMEQIGISILSSNKKFNEEKEDRQKAKQKAEEESKQYETRDHSLTSYELLRMPNIDLREEHEYKRIIVLPKMRHSVRIEVTSLKKKVRTSPPPKKEMNLDKDREQTKRSKKKEQKTKQKLMNNLILGDTNTSEFFKDHNDKKMDITNMKKEKYETVKKSIRTKHITGGRYEVTVIHSSDNQNKINLTTKRELSTDITITLKKVQQVIHFNHLENPKDDEKRPQQQSKNGERRPQQQSKNGERRPQQQPKDSERRHQQQPKDSERTLQQQPKKTERS